MKVDAGSIRIVMRSSQPEIEVSSAASPGSPTVSARKSESQEGDKGSNIHVYVRVRPLSRDELVAGVKNAVEVADDEKTIQVVDRQQSYGYTAMKTFQFDGCFGPSVSQEKLMEKCNVKKLLDSVLEGYSSTVMAYGQTGSGKTYTMCGRQEGNTPKDLGIIARSVRYLFDAIRARNTEDGQKAYSLRASYFEIYNEQVNDLLRVDCSPREVKWNQSDGFHVEGLLVVDCDSVDDVFTVMSEGVKNRKVGSHNQNRDSSRSHCIMTLYVDSISSVGDGPIVLRHGRLLFVDLAGSERLKKSKSSGDMLKETGSINRSLFTLGKVISALSEGKREEIVPYRESMLTKLIMESLGGSSLGLMIACVSPASTAVDQTLSTLHYATCTKQIVNIPSVQMDEKDRVITQLQTEINRLRDENQSLRSKLGISQQQQICSDISRMFPGCPDNTRTAETGHSRGSDHNRPFKEISEGEKGRVEDWSVIEFLTNNSEGNNRIRKKQSKLNRRQRICVGHVSPVVKGKASLRTSSRCGAGEAGGNIIVNQDAFLRILDAEV